ncbi:MAG TPA: response regulator transcription factor [Vicinamibacterales bacterium]|jgi:DNA-binding NarL/FixJ family response regulator
MRAILVGTPIERARLKAETNGSIDVVGEFASLADARASKIDADAILVAKRSAGPRDAFEEALTPREIEVLELLAQGLPNKAIAARLGISDQTVKFHVSSISGKLGAANRTDAVRRAVRRGLVTL